MQPAALEIVEQGGGGEAADVAAPLPQRRRELTEMERGWILNPSTAAQETSGRCSPRARKWAVAAVLAVTVLVVALASILAITLPKHAPRGDSNYTAALRLALRFFDAQKSGKLPPGHEFAWRGDSGLQDGEGRLVGGYYDGGSGTKFHFPLSFALTMLSWSAVEYESKFRALDEYRTVRDRIRWGTDYLLRTFDSNATAIDSIYSQVGGSPNGSHTPGDQYCWERPEQMDYPRPVQTTLHGSDLAGQMAAALAAASIVFRDDSSYSKRLVDGAEAVFSYARSPARKEPYSVRNPYVEPYYNSTGYYDELMWGAAWLYCATGRTSYLAMATDPGISSDAKAMSRESGLRVLGWDNKLPAAMMVLTRARWFVDPGYPYEDMLRSYQNATELTMCSYMARFHAFNFTRGGLIELRSGQAQDLQYVANAAFLASLYADYMTAKGIPGWNCGPSFLFSSELKEFATSQINYVLGLNPMNTSYLVGYGTKYPTHVHHRGASIPQNETASCTGGWKWRDSPAGDPNTIIGAMVRGPDRLDHFEDVRSSKSYTEPTLTGNAGLVAVLVSLTTDGGFGVDPKTIFSEVYHAAEPPPPAPWTP